VNRIAVGERKRRREYSREAATPPTVGRLLILAPVLAGYLFQSGFGLMFVSIVMGSAALLAAVMVFLLNEHGTSSSASVTPAPVTTN
jgi:hypothetical protein